MPRKKTRTGKKLTASGKVAVPSVKRGADGKIVATTAEERKAAVTTVLPTAGKDVMAPARKAEPIQIPGTLKRGGQRTYRGFGVPHKQVSSAVQAAMHHLGNMQESKGSPEFETHSKTFDAIHGNIKGMDSGLHLLLGQAKHQITSGGPQSKPILGRIQGLITSRLAEGKQAEIENKQRAQEGRQRKQGGN